MVSKVTLTGDYGYDDYRYNGGDAQAIDATGATWTVANTGSNTNLYPFLVDKAKTGIDVYGATVDGTVPLTGEWLKLYTNSAAVMLRDTKDADIYDMRISQAWDALRVAGSSDGFEISDVWVSDVRDDAFENDNPSNGAIRNSLFDGVFSGISLGHPNMSDASDKVLKLDGVLMRMESYLFKGEMTHQSPFKMESKSSKLSITDTVIAIDDVNHVGDSRLQMAWDKTIHSSNNVFLNLSDTPLPGDYPMPPAGWTVLQGKEARDYWETARADWIASRGEDFQPAAPEASGTPESGPRPAEDGRGSEDAGAALAADGTRSDDRLAGTAGSDEMRGRKGSDLLTGGSGDDDMFGGAGSDTLIGGSGDDSLAGRKGSDVLTGGAGKDAFIFDTPPASSETADTITDFETGTDKIVLDTSEFTSLRGSGDRLEAASFETGSSAEAGNDHIIYKWKTGELFYDADGSGRGAQVQFAQLDTRLDLSADDFLLV